MYDSTVDAVAHIKNIQKVIEKVIKELEKRAVEHDKSKLSDPEKDTYDKYIPELRKFKYGSPEYLDVRKKMNKEGLAHHFEVNRHHPEHFKNGIDDMNLVDVMEMVCDWYAASMKSDTSFEGGFKQNAERFGISEQLCSIMINTYNDILK